MKDVIKLTRQYKERNYSQYIMPRNITYFEWSTSHNVTRIYFIGGGDNGSITVIETPEQIENQINGK